MRVPDISSTAGYAVQINKKENSANLTDLVHNKKGNSYITSNGYSPTTYAASADEFVKKALSSSHIESPTPSVQQFRSTGQNELSPSSSAKECRSDLTEFYDTDAYSDNTYRSFKEVFNISKTFFEDNGLDIKNTNTLENQCVNISNTDLDPILIINSKLQNKSDTSIYSHAHCISTVSKIDVKTNANGSQSPELSDIILLQESSNIVRNLHYKNEPDVSNDNDYDDHPMVDLCGEEITKSTYGNDELDEYLTSQSSSCNSLHTPKRLYFPRGIINPNYPGFQHFAHTLSEHFIGSTPSDSYDSDLSEMELSADSFEDLPQTLVHVNKLNTYNNNNNNILHIKSDQFFENELPKLIKTHSLIFSTKNDEMDNNNSDDLPKNLDTVLTFLEPPKCSIHSAKQDAYLRSENLEQNLITKNKLNDIKFESTPDILIKNSNSLHIEANSKKENRPDLLRGVSPQYINNQINEFFEDILIENNAKSSRSMTEAHSYNSDIMRNTATSKDEISVGIAPVDIIGNFGQEVEREFGLLVSGYRRLVDAHIEDKQVNLKFGSENPIEKVIDAELSSAKDEIDSHKLLVALNHIRTDSIFNEDDNNAVDWSCEIIKGITDMNLSKKENLTTSRTGASQKSKYRKPSYDDRQLPPVAIDYKRCQQSLRTSRKQQNGKKTAKEMNLKVLRNHPKPNFANRFVQTKRGVSNLKSDKLESNADRKREEEEIYQYQQLISDKELILNKSKYSKMSTWAQYLKNSVQDRELLSPSTLDLFDAYKIGTEIDLETLQKHLKMAKEIEKQRRSDREEIRRRLAMGDGEYCIERNERQNWRPNIQSRIGASNGIHFSRMNDESKDASSDTESHSSDSETCPKLSKTSYQKNIDLFDVSLTDKSSHPYNGRPLSVSSSVNNINKPQHQQSILLPLNNDDDDKECDFFTKQAKLQIEARMALAQAKEMAHMQMEIDRQNQRISPITAIIRDALDKVGVQMSTEKRRVSRQMLTEMNIAQLQTLVNSLHTHIEGLNEGLVNFLLERDDLHMGQDSMLVDIEELTRYIGANEHIAQQVKNNP